MSHVENIEGINPVISSEWSVEGINLSIDQIQAKLKKRERKFSDGFKAHLSNLAANGHLDEVLRKRNEANIHNRIRALDELEGLKESCTQVGALSDNPDERALAEFTVIHILIAQEKLTREAGVASLQAIYNNNPKSADYLEEHARSTIDNIGRLILLSR